MYIHVRDIRMYIHVHVHAYAPHFVQSSSEKVELELELQARDKEVRACVVDIMSEGMYRAYDNSRTQDKVWSKLTSHIVKSEYVPLCPENNLTGLVV